MCMAVEFKVLSIKLRGSSPGAVKEWELTGLWN